MSERARAEEPLYPDSVDAVRDIGSGQLDPVEAAEELEAIETAAAGKQPAGVPEPGEVEVPTALRSEIERAMSHYPEVRSASIPALWAVQRRYGWCSPEGIHQAAAVLGLTPAYLQSVASFYDLFHTEPVGRHSVLVCTNITCWMRGADDLLASFCDAAGTEPGGTSDDGKVFVRGFECLGACDLAPMASIDGEYFGPLTTDEAERAVEALRSGDEVLPKRRLAERGAAGGKRNPADDRTRTHPLNKAATRGSKGGAK